MGDGPPPSAGWKERLDSMRSEEKTRRRDLRIEREEAARKRASGGFFSGLLEFAGVSIVIAGVMIFFALVVLAVIGTLAAIVALAGDIVGLWDTVSWL